MFKNRKQAFHNYLCKRRKLVLEGLFSEKLKYESEGVNENSPFFVWENFSKKRSPPGAVRRGSLRENLDVLREAPEGFVFRCKHNEFADISAFACRCEPIINSQLYHSQLRNEAQKRRLFTPPPPPPPINQKIFQSYSSCQNQNWPEFS